MNTEDELKELSEGLGGDLGRVVGSGALLAALVQPERWKSLLVDDEYPHVERLYTDYEGQSARQIFLHRTSEAPEEIRPLYHPHPWPSIVLVLSTGDEQQYAMRVGTKDTTVMRLAAAPPICYTMLDPNGWHSVATVRGPAWSIMMVGAPWPEHHARETARLLSPLPPKRASALLRVWPAYVQELMDSGFGREYAPPRNSKSRSLR